MAVRSDAGGRWVSVHVCPAGDFREFLLRRLLPRLLEARKQGLIRRFFFILYSEGGLHVRIRLLSRAGVTSQAIGGVADPGAEGTMTWHRYSRVDHYFGETMLSVYAELLNEATSWLALRILSIDSPTLRWLTLTSLLHHLLRAGGDDPGLDTSLIESQRFAREAAARFGLAGASGRVFPGSSDVTAAAVGAGAILQSDRSVVRIVRLLRRVRRRAGGRPVATHALHLLCNKVGLTIPQELEILQSLAAVVAAQRSAHDGCR